MRERRWARVVIAAAVTTLVAGAVGWSVARLTLPPAEVVDEPDYVTVLATLDEVRSEISLSAGSRWPADRSLTALLPGTVTSLTLAEGTVVVPGTVIYSVDLTPVVLIAGAVPAFRTMGLGMVGPDVSQLQEFLAAQGWSVGPVDGRFGPGTEAAVRGWQEAIGTVPDGVVDLGEVLFVDRLPRVVTRDDALAVGRVLAIGDRVATVLAAAPVFDLTVSDRQSAEIPDGALVDITGTYEWTGIVGDRTTTDEGDVVLSLEGVNGGPVCGKECATVPIDGRTAYDAVIETRAPVRGVTIPAGAVRTAPDLSTVVVDKRGRTHAVTVVATVDGWSVVRGIEEGLGVRVPLVPETSP